MLNNLTKEQIKEMGKKARQKVERNNDKDLYYSKILNMYEGLLKDNQQGPVVKEA